MNELMVPGEIESLVGDPYGNYVVQVCWAHHTDRGMRVVCACVCVIPMVCH